MTKRNLTTQQKMFVYNILEGMNQTDAYLSAGYKCTRSAARRNAARLMTKADIKDAIEKVQGRAAEKAEVTQEKIIAEESRLAFYDPKELFDANGKMLPIHELPENIRRALHGLEIIHTRLGDVKYKYKFHDKGRALERLEKIEGMFSPEKHEIDFDGKVTIIDSYALSDDDRDTP